MDKKIYNKPEMKIVLLMHRPSLLEGSPDPYDPDNNPAPQLELDEE